MRHDVILPPGLKSSEIGVAHVSRLTYESLMQSMSDFVILFAPSLYFSPNNRFIINQRDSGSMTKSRNDIHSHRSRWLL